MLAQHVICEATRASLEQGDLGGEGSEGPSLSCRPPDRRYN